ncbi:hypothetical protein Y1Q_0019182 [Alligator mississippiensis]|uniref:Uncharacterized protein n=1 Tax=Alligator mississippiensis TaxID=8496 RepID=A0A151MQA5_ALLMI|nr:hypothetical protein Y1Q_0019182 [Alligator mississippiensis]
MKVIILNCEKLPLTGIASATPPSKSWICPCPGLLKYSNGLLWLHFPRCCLSQPGYSLIFNKIIFTAAHRRHHKKVVTHPNTKQVPHLA